MKGLIVAPVKRVLRGHSDRSLVHAIEEAGLESKIEVPSEAVRDLVPGQQYVLVVSWALQPASASAPTAAPATLPTTVDEEFMALMARPRGLRRSTSAGPAQAVPPSPTTAGASAPPPGSTSPTTGASAPPPGSTSPTTAGSAPPNSGVPTMSVAEQLAQRLGIRSSSPTG